MSDDRLLGIPINECCDFANSWISSNKTTAQSPRIGIYNLPVRYIFLCREVISHDNVGLKVSSKLVTLTPWGIDRCGGWSGDPERSGSLIRIQVEERGEVSATNQLTNCLLIVLHTNLFENDLIEMCYYPAVGMYRNINNSTRFCMSRN